MLIKLSKMVKVFMLLQLNICDISLKIYYYSYNVPWIMNGKFGENTEQYLMEWKKNIYTVRIKDTFKYIFQENTVNLLNEAVQRCVIW